MLASDGLPAVAAGGDLGATLRALRDDLAQRYALCESDRDAAALASRLTDVLDRIAALPADVKGTALDELAKRRGAGDGLPARVVRSGSR